MARPNETPPRDRCTDHNLWFATFPTPSADGTRVYVLCSCGRPREVSPAVWQAEVARRAAAARGRGAVSPGAAPAGAPASGRATSS
jgi:hypothetical protein